MSLVRDGIITRETDLDPATPGLLVAIATRFNMAISAFRTRPVTNDMRQWVAKRSEIFLSLTLPSIVNQETLPRYWFIGFDGENRDHVADLLATLEQYPWIIPVWQTMEGARYRNPLTCFAEAITQRIEPDDTHVISVRMDNDDAMHRDFLSSLIVYARAVLKENVPEDFWVTFPFGVQSNGTDLRALMYATNTFLARSQSVAHFTADPAPSALNGRHNLVYEHGNVFHALTTQPMWLMNVHGANVRNKVNRKLPRLCDTVKILRDFGATD